MPRIEDLMLFVQAADCGGLSAAARELDIAPAAASAALKRLEAALGARLFVRSTRSLRLTTDGERYLVHARAVLLALDEGAASVARDAQTIGGDLSLSIPSDLGRNVMLPWLDEFQAQHPALRLRIRISDRLADLYRQTIDVAIRYGEPEDSGMVALPLAPDNRRVLCASPAYFKRHAAPQKLSDLQSHNCLRFVLGDAVHERWNFWRNKKMETITVDGDRVSDDGDLVRRWALAGNGLAYKSRLDVSNDLKKGRLIATLSNYQGERAPLNLVCAHRLMLSPAVVSLRDFLRQRLEQLKDG
ncbi:LysR family transcriptional regulator [Herminiimonas sp. KBW02]|uniref:LysR family transcriptional regulator n=1 Tax=Herminiimonas sp. KBW02 TaxID=2153363 RepID=UPI000F5B30FD|nr:LysR family transcriptional regulator [Herminiimonas sp. KBW02]RQO36578.1 LysR family transcriptional regulator [Herminiimonas sp. KBW02]